MCREDYDDEPEPSSLEKIIKEAEEMAKNIRRIRSTHHRTKLETAQIQKNKKVNLKSKMPELGIN